MDADAFLGLTQGSPQNPGLEAPEPKVTEPEPVLFSNHTPSGILVEYSPNPRFYRVNGTEVPSVTTVLDVLQKGGLPWWGMQVGIQGVIELFDMGLLTVLTDFPDTTERLSIRGESQFADAARIVQELTAQKLTVNHVRDKAGDRGTNIHKLLEDWADTGKFSVPRFLEPHEVPYANAIQSWLDDLPCGPLLSEVMVGSDYHGYAGRYDLVIEVEEPTEVVVRALKKPRMDTVFPGKYMVDLKTSAGVYATHHLQLAAYEEASVECGYERTNGQYILHVTKDGKYEFVRSKGTPVQFLAVKSAHDAVKGLR